MPNGKKKANVSKRLQKNNLQRSSADSIALNVRTDLQNAVVLHQRGRLAEAEQIYREILKVAPDHFDATHLLGVALVQDRRLVEGERLISKAVELKPTDAA